MLTLYQQVSPLSPQLLSGQSPAKLTVETWCRIQVPLLLFGVFAFALMFSLFSFIGKPGCSCHLLSCHLNSPRMSLGCGISFRLAEKRREGPLGKVRAASGLFTKVWLPAVSCRYICENKEVWIEESSPFTVKVEWGLPLSSLVCVKIMWDASGRML